MLWHMPVVDASKGCHLVVMATYDIALKMSIKVR